MSVPSILEVSPRPLLQAAQPGGSAAYSPPATAATATSASCLSGAVQDLTATAPYATFSGLASGKAYRAAAWPDYDSATVFGAAASKTIAGSSFDNPASATIVYGSALTLSTKLKVARRTPALPTRLTLRKWQEFETDLRVIAVRQPGQPRSHMIDMPCAVRDPTGL
jgi:hypothetical protein